MADRRRPFEAAVAQEMWTHDGRPDGGADPTEWSRGNYSTAAALVFDSLERLGLKVVRRA